MKEVSAGLLAEASAWLAVLHGPNRTADVEQSLSRWLKAHPDHAQAFELATEAWDEPLPKNIRRPHRAPLFKASPVSVAWAATLVLVAIGAFFYLRPSGLATGVGEQRLVVLEDRSRVLLNTATRIVVHYDAHERRIELENGEALFEVARQPNRPFVVMAGNRLVKALGTSFVIRRDAHQVAITLIEGKVEVASVAPSGGGEPEESQTILVPGQRLTLAEKAPARLDRPEIDRVLAWQRREVALDNTALHDAIAEMNRYNVIPLVIEEPQLGELRISGRFRAGDSSSFAHALATTYPLEVTETPDRIVLSAAR